MNLSERLALDLNEYKPIPFWSWNDKLDEAELKRQIRDMKQNGIGGFFMHARGGLLTEYMGEEWFSAVAACLDEAEKQGMRAWAYDENGWPSGFAGMKLLNDPANHAHYLTCEARASFDADALACYRVEEGELIRVTRDEGESCVCLYDKTNSSVVDILNWKIVRAFLDETHEKYAARFRNNFGSVFAGFFTDEPQYFRYDTAYSPVLLRKYKERYGEDLLDVLGALFIDCNQSDRARYRYWKLMNDTYTESFAGQIYRWCQEHNCKLTGHSIEERNMFWQMICCAGVMPFYEYEHIPGIDWLGRDIGDEIAPRQAASVAMQLGKKHVLTETFACAGWDVTPRELKRIAEWQYVNGVNLMCQHLYPYSLRGQRKRDYPAFFSNHNPWINDSKAFNDYFTCLGYILAESREVADVAVISPIHSAYFDFKRNDPHSLDALDKHFSQLVESLGARGIGHHYIDETLLAKYGQVRGGRLLMGKCAYSCVVVPDMKGLDSRTVELLRAFTDNGGKLHFAGARAPYLVDGVKTDIGLESNIEFEDIKNPGVSIDRFGTRVRATVRRSEFGDFIYAVNLSADEAYELTYHVNARGAREFKLLTREYAPIYFKPCESGGIDIPVRFEPGQSIVIFLSGGAESADTRHTLKSRACLTPAAIIERMDENALTLDMAQISYDGVNYDSPMPVMAVSDRLLRERQNRIVYIKYVFNVRAKPARIRAEAEYARAAGAYLNGEPVVFGERGAQDNAFVSADLAGKLRYGANELVFKLDYYQPEHVYDVFNGVYYEHNGATESLINCLSYVTDIECVYLRGDFCVECAEYTPGAKNTLIANAPFTITLGRRLVTLDSLAKDGFPFFGGSMTLRTRFNATGAESRLKLIGRYALAKVRVNGGDTRLLLLGDECQIDGDVKRGLNELEITLVSSMRNLYGPFHNAGDPEPYAVSPATFERYGTWEGGKSERYDERYAFAFFGINEIRVM